jgi:hypothetical protein
MSQSRPQMHPVPVPAGRLASLSIVGLLAVLVAAALGGGCAGNRFPAGPHWEFAYNEYRYAVYYDEPSRAVRQVAMLPAEPTDRSGLIVVAPGRSQSVSDGAWEFAGQGVEPAAGDWLKVVVRIARRIRQDEPGKPPVVIERIFSLNRQRDPQDYRRIRDPKTAEVAVEKYEYYTRGSAATGAPENKGRITATLVGE